MTTTIHTAQGIKGIPPHDDKLDMIADGKLSKAKRAQSFENVLKQFLYSGHYVSILAVNWRDFN